MVDELNNIVQHEARDKPKAEAIFMRVIGPIYSRPSTAPTINQIRNGLTHDTVRQDKAPEDATIAEIACYRYGEAIAYICDVNQRESMPSLFSELLTYTHPEVKGKVFPVGKEGLESLTSSMDAFFHYMGNLEHANLMRDTKNGQSFSTNMLLRPYATHDSPKVSRMIDFPGAIR